MSNLKQEWRGRDNLGRNIVWEGILIGLLAGLVISASRLLIGTVLDKAEIMYGALSREPVLPVLLVGAVLLAALGFVSGLLVRSVPLIAGSGIPQVSAQLSGRLISDWRKVLPAKFAGGVLALGAGLSLGREGPSVQMGAAVGQGVGELLKRPVSERRFLISSGAAAGLAAAFNAPLAGIVFTLEEIHKNVSLFALIGAMSAAASADFVSVWIFGMKPVLNLSEVALPRLSDYWIFLFLGIFTGFSGVLFNRLLLTVKRAFGKLPLPVFWKTMIPFLLTGLLCLLEPRLLGSGEELLYLPGAGNLTPGHVALLYLLKLLLVLICFGSGLPGGIFFPLLVLGSLAGNLTGQAAAAAGLISGSLVLTCALLAMAGHFSAIVRAPLTGILLISEMSGSFHLLLPLTIVSLISYLVAEFLRTEPVYESLQKELLRQRGSRPAAAGPRQRMLLETAVEFSSPADGRKVSEIDWPENILLVSVKRGSRVITPRGSLSLRGGDYVELLLNRDDLEEIQNQLSPLFRAAVSLRRNESAPPPAPGAPSGPAEK